MKKIGIITQARFGSSRLPGKILLKAGGKTLLEHHLDRLKKTGYEVVVATSDLPHEKPIIELCEKIGVPITCGSENDVLSRFHKTNLRHQFDVLVRVTSDCPLIDPVLVHEGVSEREKLQSESPYKIYYSNTIDRTYARGFDFEVFDSEMLNEANDLAKTSSEREHVTPYFYLEKSPRIRSLQKKQSENHSQLRVTVDEQADYDLIRRLIEEHQAEKMSYQEIESLLLKNEELRKINCAIEQKKI